MGIAAIALISYQVIQNQKDKKELEKKLNQDYHKTKDKEGESTIQ